MRLDSGLQILLAIALILFPAAAAGAAELDDHLAFLAPLCGGDWSGGYVGEGSRSMEIILHFEPILAGKAVRYRREARAVEFFAETRFFWSPDRGEVRFVHLNSRGMVGEGAVEFLDGEIVLRGTEEWPGETMESETRLRLDTDGVLTDVFNRREADEWVRGHVQEFRRAD